MTIPKRRALLVLLVLGLLVALGGAYAVAAREDGAEAAKNGGAEPTEQKAEAAEDGATKIKGKGAIDPKDESQIVGSSSDVFFGWVVKRSGSEGAPTTKPGFEQPMTQYAAEVTEAIKGDASGRVTVNQLGGYVDNGHEGLDLIKGDSLLESEQEYLFATNYVEEKDWYQIVLAGVANIKVEDEAQRQELKQRFEEAKASQVKVNVPSGPPSLEEVEKRYYRPCWPDGSTPPGWDRPCDPTDPLPPGKSKYSSGQPE